MPSADRLTALQRDVARAFFSLPESAGFLVVGGAGLVAQGVVDRPTDDLDFFTSRGLGDVHAAAHALVHLAGQHGWSASIDRTAEEFVRLRVVRGDESTTVDLAVDASPAHPPVVSFLGPTLNLEDAAVSKVLAVFGRAEPRDFVDLRALAERFDRDALLTAAAQADRGFDRAVLAQMMRMVVRFDDDEFPVEPEQVSALRGWYLAWADGLS